MTDATFHEERSKGLGGSDAAAVCGVHPFKTPLQLYLEKRGELEGVERSERDKERMRFGLLLEDVIADEYTRRTERKTRRQTRASYHPDHKELLVHLDRRVYPCEHDDYDGPGVLEIKSPSVWTAKDWSDDEAPTHYNIQMQHSLMVTGLGWGAFAVLVGKDRFVTFDVKHDPDFCNTLREAELRFWERVVEGDPPEATHRDNEVLAALYRTENSTSEPVLLDERFVELDRQRTDYLEAAKEAKKRADAISAQIKGAMGDAPMAVLPDGSGYFAWKTRERKAYNVAAKSYRHFQRYK